MTTSAPNVIVRRAIDEDRIPELLRGERPYVIGPEYMSPDPMPQNYPRMWEVLAKEPDGGGPSVSAKIEDAMRRMTETAGDAYLLAYALLPLLQNDVEGNLRIDTQNIFDLLRQRLPMYKSELATMPDSGGMPQGKWGDLIRLSRVTGVPFVQ